MNFVMFDELGVNFDKVSVIRLRQNQNDGSFRNMREFPFIVDLYTSGNSKPFTVHLTSHMKEELAKIVQVKNLEGGCK
jgi:hypothetical protein